MSLPVVVADDSTMSRKLTIKALPDDWDVDVTQAADGQEALAACRQGKADVMFLDLTMPGMSGFDVLEAIRDEGLECVVVVISADIQPKARERAIELGAVDFIRKPVDSGEVARVLDEFGLR
ncbi:MAG: response regulator [Ectothiorhodospiraceae bacterium]|jgi:CheY-like chemotaxis protein